MSWYQGHMEVDFQLIFVCPKFVFFWFKHISFKTVIQKEDNKNTSFCIQM